MKFLLVFFVVMATACGTETVLPFASSGSADALSTPDGADVGLSEDGTSSEDTFQGDVSETALDSGGDADSALAGQDVDSADGGILPDTEDSFVSPDVTTPEDSSSDVDVPTSDVSASIDTDLGELDSNPQDTEADVGEQDAGSDAVDFDAGQDVAPLDTDGDGVPDSAEAFLGTDPNNPDTDGDGLGDGLELGKVGDADPTTTTNPLKADTDGDGAPDGVEDANHNGKVDFLESDPNNAADGGVFTPCPQGCNDANSCTTDTCDVQTSTCKHTPNNWPCDDGNPATIGDYCANSICKGLVACNSDTTQLEGGPFSYQCMSPYVINKNVLTQYYDHHAVLLSEYQICVAAGECAPAPTSYYDNTGTHLVNIPKPYAGVCKAAADGTPVCGGSCLCSPAENEPVRVVGNLNTVKYCKFIGAGVSTQSEYQHAKCGSSYPCNPPLKFLGDLAPTPSKVCTRRAQYGSAPILVSSVNWNQSTGIVSDAPAGTAGKVTTVATTVEDACADDPNLSQDMSFCPPYGEDALPRTIHCSYTKAPVCN